MKRGAAPAKASNGAMAIPPDRADCMQPEKGKQSSIVPFVSTGHKGRDERRTLNTTHVVRSPWNREHFSESGMDELIESVREHGVLQDAIVRPYEDRDAHRMVDRHRIVDRALAEGARKAGVEVFELIAGERRWRAAAACGVDLPVKILWHCTDEQAIELQEIEN